MEDRWFTLREAAAEDKHPAHSTLRKYIAEGKLSAIKDARGHIQLRESDLAALTRPIGRPRFDHIEAAIERIVDAAPPLTDEQREHLAAIVSGGRP